MTAGATLAPAPREAIHCRACRLHLGTFNRTHSRVILCDGVASYIQLHVAEFGIICPACGAHRVLKAGKPQPNYQQRRQRSGAASGMM